MNFFTIDQEKCNRDGMCVQGCPAQMILFKEKDAFPSLLEDAEAFYIDRGHCVAVCPH